MRLLRRLFSGDKKKEDIKNAAIVLGLITADQVNAKVNKKSLKSLVKYLNKVVRQEGEIGEELSYKLKRLANTQKDLEYRESKGKASSLSSSSKGDRFKININTKDANSPSIIAHEYGHYKNKKIKGLTPGSFVRKNTKVSYNPLASKIVTKVGGLASGLDQAKRESEGKDGGVTKYGGIITSGIISSPKLLEEATASIRADKLLRKSGASKKQLRLARKNLIGSLGTYGLNASSGMIQGAIFQGLGKVAGKYYYNKDKEKIEK